MEPDVKQELQDSYEQTVRRFTYDELKDAQSELELTQEVIKLKLDVLTKELKDRHWTL